MPALGNPLVDSKFALNALEFIGLIGGTEFIYVLAMIPLYRGRRWLGWYNAPGSLGIARHLFNFASSFQTRPYGNRSPTSLLGFDSKAGPHFVPAFSGEELPTGHLGYLALERSKEMASGMDRAVEEEDGTPPAYVTLVDLGRVDLDSPFPPLHASHTLYALIPMVISIVTCLLCALVADWCMFAVILDGIITSGFVTTVIGSARLRIQSPRLSTLQAPCGRGILVSGDTVVVVRGEEDGISAITRGVFELKGDKHWPALIYFCSLAYLVEFLVQFIVIPQGTLFGQIMFVTSIGVSRVYSYCLVSFKTERLQAELLFAALGQPSVRNLHAGSSTSMAVLVCLLLFHDVHHLATPNEYDRILSVFVPDVTPLWRVWKDKVITQLANVDDVRLSHLELSQEDQGLSERDRGILRDRLRDAAAAFTRYNSV